MSLLIKKEQVEHAISVIQEKTELEPFFLELKTVIKEISGWEVLDFCVEHYWKLRGIWNQKLITMLLYENLAYQRPSDKVKLDEINKQMQILNKKYSFISKRRLFPTIGFFDFAPIYRNNCVEITAEIEIPFLTEKYRDNGVKFIDDSGLAYITVFYNFEEDLDRNEKNGTNQEIKEYFYGKLKANDVLGIISKDDFIIRFSSEEYLVKECDGNLYYFYK